MLKRTASPESLIADVRKQIADAKERRGLFQLHEKLKAIQAGMLPEKLSEKYKNVKRFYPMISSSNVLHRQTQQRC